MEITIEKNIEIPISRKKTNDGMMAKVRSMVVGDCALVLLKDVSSFKVSLHRAFGSGSYRMQKNMALGMCRFWRVS